MRLIVGLVGFCLVIFGYRLFHKEFESVLQTHGGNLRPCPATQVVWGEAIKDWVHGIFHSWLPCPWPWWCCSDVLPAKAKHPTKQINSPEKTVEIQIYNLSHFPLQNDLQFLCHKRCKSCYKSGLLCYTKPHWNGYQLWLPCFSLTMTLLQRRPSAASGKCLHLPLWPHWLLVHARDLPACTHSYPLQQNTTVPSRIRMQPVPIKEPGKGKELQPMGAEHAHQHTFTKSICGSECGQQKCPGHAICHANWPAVSFSLPVVPLTEFHRDVLTSLEYFHLAFRWRQESGGTRGTCTILAVCKVQLPPPSLLYDPANICDALSHHLHCL